MSFRYLLDSIAKRRIQKPNQKSIVAHILQRYLTTFSRYVFLQKFSIIDARVGSKQALGNNVRHIQNAVKSL